MQYFDLLFTARSVWPVPVWTKVPTLAKRDPKLGLAFIGECNVKLIDWHSCNCFVKLKKSKKIKTLWMCINKQLANKLAFTDNSLMFSRNGWKSHDEMSIEILADQSWVNRQGMTFMLTNTNSSEIQFSLLSAVGGTKRKILLINKISCGRLSKKIFSCL